eukprot:101473-Pyramimonas_sp.AAC.1
MRGASRARPRGGISTFSRRPASSSAARARRASLRSSSTTPPCTGASKTPRAQSVWTRNEAPTQGKTRSKASRTPNA